MAQATYGVGVYGTDSYDELVYSTVLTTVREKPPLRVTMDIETPAGKHYRWAEDEPAPENVPSGLRWSDTMPGGFESLDCTLLRKPGIDYSDLEQLSTIRVLGASGDVAGEYRLERSPRTSGDEVSISPGAVGWQAHLEDDKSAREIYIDQDLTRWQDPSTQRRLSLISTSWGINSPQVSPDSGGMPALITTIVGPWDSASRGLCEAWYDGQGIPIGEVAYWWSKGVHINHTDGNWQWLVVVSDDELHLVNQTSGNLRAVGPGAGTLVATTTTRKWATVQTYYTAGPAGIDGSNYDILWTTLGVYGTHGLTRQVLTGYASGFYASDIVTHAVGKFAPSLTVTSESVQASSFIIPQMVFLEPTTAGEIVRQATRFGLQDWAIWENKTFWWHERGAFSKLWRSRVAPAQLDETGPQVDRLWESIIVQYQDVDGTARTVGPPGSGAHTEDASLKDADPDNPANQLGITRRDILQMGTTTSAGAIEVGRRFLEESQLLDRSGRARIVGHVEDSSGVLHPYWRPRAGDYISFIDASDTSYRRIVKTDKSHSERTCGLDLDAPPEGLKALLERLGVVLVPLGLS